MPDSFYPSVDLSFITEHIVASGKLEKDGIIKVGDTTIFVVAGPQAIFKRNTLIRELEPGQVCLEQATALALKFSFLGPLMEWLETERGWKEGAYLAQTES